MMQMRLALPRGPLPDPERPYAPPAFATRSRPNPMFPITLLRRVLTAAALAASLAQAAPTRLPSAGTWCEPNSEPDLKRGIRTRPRAAAAMSVNGETVKDRTWRSG